MIQQEEAEKLICRFITLREDALKTNSSKDIKIFKDHERKCIDKFSYLITMNTSKYRKFNNYDDLNQEGFEALLKAMKNYDPLLGSFFWWAHKYIRTRVMRCASLHTAIRYPLKYTKENTPHKESSIPLMIDDKNCPEKTLEGLQVSKAINDSTSILSPERKEAVTLAFGLNGDEPMSINKICRELSMTRSYCLKTIRNSLTSMKQNIKI